MMTFLSACWLLFVHKYLLISPLTLLSNVSLGHQLELYFYPIAKLFFKTNRLANSQSSTSSSDNNNKTHILWSEILQTVTVNQKWIICATFLLLSLSLSSHSFIQLAAYKNWTFFLSFFLLETLNRLLRLQ
jgi:hypothetical protein